jgi:hypothetical protein
MADGTSPPAAATGSIRTRNSLTGVADDSETFLDEKLGIVVSGPWRDDREQQFDRVVELAGLPDVFLLLQRSEWSLSTD